MGALASQPTSAHADTTIPGAFYSTPVTWTLSGSPYILTGFVSISGNGRLTIEPGVVVKFDPSQYIGVSDGGALIAQGTTAHPIVFTSNAVTPQPGDWGYISLGRDSSGQISNCDISFGGKNGYWTQVLIHQTSHATVENCRIHDSANAGMLVSGSPTLRNLVIERNVGLAVGQEYVQMQPAYDNLTFRDNGTNGVYLPYSGSGNPQYSNGAPFVFNGLGVNGGSVVTVTPGTELRFISGQGIDVYETSRLVARGTSTQPITFTASVSNPVPGAWAGITIRDGGSVRFEYCDIGYGGSNNGSYFTGNLYIRGKDVSVDRCAFHHSLNAGIRTSSNQARSFTNNIITNNNFCGIVNQNGGGSQQLTLRNNIIANNADCGVLNDSALAIVDARRNWWGFASGPKHPSTNPNGQGNSASDRVMFDPWLQTLPNAVSFEPAQGGNVGSTTVRFWGLPNTPVLGIALKRAGQPDLAGVYRGATPDEGVDYTFTLSGTQPSAGQFVASGPGAATIPSNFSVVSAPPTARLDASEHISVTINARIRARVGQPVPVFINYFNNGLVDAPPMEVKVYAQAGLNVQPSPTSAYVAGKFTSTVPSSDGLYYTNLASFVQPSIRPKSINATPVTFVPLARGEYQYRIEYVSSDALAPAFDTISAAPMNLSVALQNVTSTKLETTFHGQNGSFDGTGSFSLERQGATSYFTPTVTMTDDGSTVTYRFTAAVLPGPASSAQAFAAKGAIVNYQRVQQVVTLSKALNEKLRNSYYTPFIQAELQRLQRLSKLGCLGDLGIFDANHADDKQVIDTANNMGDFARLSVVLNRLMKEAPYSFEFSQHLAETDEALNNVWSDQIAQTLTDRLNDQVHTHPELNGLRDVLTKHRLDPNKVSSDDLMRTVNELCYKKEPKQVHVVTGIIEAFDPNDKTGNAGVGPQHFVYPDETLSYAIEYENVPTATAPAAVITISDTLDLSTLDLSTLKLGFHSFSDTISSAGAGALPFSKDIDLRPNRNLIVRVEADLVGSSTLVWKLTSIDPATGLEPLDPLQGFLPPNKNGTEGQGYVYFTIRLKPGLKEGTVISNKATVVFDNNAPIDTPTWSNTIWTGPKVFLPLLMK